MVTRKSRWAWSTQLLVSCLRVEGTQNPLSYGNRLERKFFLIGNIIEKVNFWFKWNWITLWILLQNNLEVTLKIVKKNENLLKKFCRFRKVKTLNFYRPQTKFGVRWYFRTFTGVCHSTGGGGSASGGMGLGRPPPPSPSDNTGYGQRAGGTHPTGMHSCVHMK